MSDEQQRQPGWIGGQMDELFLHRALVSLGGERADSRPVAVLQPTDRDAVAEHQHIGRPLQKDVLIGAVGAQVLFRPLLRFGQDLFHLFLADRGDHIRDRDMGRRLAGRLEQIEQDVVPELPIVESR
jgi:hypothetical protein